MIRARVVRTWCGWYVCPDKPSDASTAARLYELYADAQALALWLNDRANGYPKRDLPYPPDETRAALWAARYAAP